MPTRTRKIRNKLPRASRPHMPGYGVPTAGKGLLPWSWAKRRLEESHNYWITTVRPDGAPHTMIVWGLWLEGWFCFSTGQQSRKARNLAENPRCIVCTECADEAVIVEGEASQAADPQLLHAFFRKYEKKYNFDMSAFRDEPVFVLRPCVAFGLPEKRFPKAVTRWRFSSTDRPS
ncbi:MAG TPA: pyridoxamine 5'-phosphate oxidase family protein [Acidobacteriota bacterium]|nr:pyridoxamine 5'-phosphate oxidase family protein [Acidobacteriota bacterium]